MATTAKKVSLACMMGLRYRTRAREAARQLQFHEPLELNATATQGLIFFTPSAMPLRA